MQYSGKVTYIGPVEEIGENKTPKITFVLTEITDREYPGSLAVDIWGDKTGLIDGVAEGDEITAFLNSRSREYNGRYYNSISAWRIEKGNGGTTKPEEDEDLPF